MKGIVKEYDNSKGYGFIAGENGEDYFVHVYGLGPKLKALACVQVKKYSLMLNLTI